MHAAHDHSSWHPRKGGLRKGGLRRTGLVIALFFLVVSHEGLSLYRTLGRMTLLPTMNIHEDVVGQLKQHHREDEQEQEQEQPPHSSPPYQDVAKNHSSVPARAVGSIRSRRGTVSKNLTRVEQHVMAKNRQGEIGSTAPPSHLHSRMIFAPRMVMLHDAAISVEFLSNNTPVNNVHSNNNNKNKKTAVKVEPMMVKRKEEGSVISVHLYYGGSGDPHCKTQHEWQKMFYPTCNSMHELDMTDLTYERSPLTHDKTPSIDEKVLKHGKLKRIAGGGMRIVWSVYDTPEINSKHNSSEHGQPRRFALKTPRYGLSVNENVFRGHQIDAMVAERLTKSPHIVDIFNFCGNSGIFDFADYDMHQAVGAIRHKSRNTTSLQRLHLGMHFELVLNSQNGGNQHV